MRDIAELTEEDLTRSLAYAGFVLVAYELVKSLIVGPIKAFYSNITFGPGMPFKTYESDVLSRHKNEFEACLLYLRDFMKVIDSDDLLAIQGLRKHRNDLAHDLVERLSQLDIAEYWPLLEKADRALFKLSNHQTYMEIGSDPAFQNKGINWDTVKGHEYVLFEEVLRKVRLLDRGTK
jgi:hypothetical protein